MKKIEQYAFGLINIDGYNYASDLIIYPDRVQTEWWRKDSHRLQLEDIADVLADPPEVLVVGQGNPGRLQVDPRVTDTLDKLNVELIAEPTGKACNRFNDLSEKGKRVVAALHLTC